MLEYLEKLVSSGLGKLHKSSNNLESQKVQPCADFYVIRLRTDMADGSEYLVNGKKLLFQIISLIAYHLFALNIVLACND